MKIDPKLKIRTVVGEAVVLLPGKDAKDMTKVLALNPTSQFLWENLSGKEFTMDDAVALLGENYDVSKEQATEDVEKWIAQLREIAVIE